MPNAHLDLAGLSLDCADPDELARFDLDLLAGRTLWTDRSSTGIRTSTGLILVAQKIDGFARPVWPGRGVVHLDLNAGGDLEGSVRSAIVCGAT